MIPCLVDVLPFEQFLAESKISKVGLLKLDCEGAELQILRSIGVFSRVGSIVLEASAGQSAELRCLLESNGFSVFCRLRASLCFLLQGFRHLLLSPVFLFALAESRWN